MQEKKYTWKPQGGADQLGPDEACLDQSDPDYVFVREGDGPPRKIHHLIFAPPSSGKWNIQMEFRDGALCPHEGRCLHEYHHRPISSLQELADILEKYPCLGLIGLSKAR